MSLIETHPVWTTAVSAFEVSKAATVAEMLSGRYITKHRARHWNKENPDGLCQLCMVTHADVVEEGTLDHILLRCICLQETRAKACSLWNGYISDKPFLQPIVEECNTGLSGDDLRPCLELLLDPSTVPIVISTCQDLGKGILSHLLYLTRTWCHMHHLRRKRLLKLYNII